MSKVKKAVIALAGLTSRFLPAAKGCPKGLTPVLAKPVAQYLVEELLGAGIKEICLVHTHGDPRIKRYFTPDLKLINALKKAKKIHLLESLQKLQKKVKIWKFIPQPRRLPYGNATPILAAKSFINHQPFVYLFGDDLLIEDKPGQYLVQMIKVFEKYQPDAILGAQKVAWSEISRYGSIKYDKDPKYPHRVKKVLEKLPAQKAPSNTAQFGRFVYSAKIFEILNGLKPTSKSGQIKELWLADANNLLAQKGLVIAQPIKAGHWLTTGDPLRWLQTNLAMAWQDKKMKREIKKFLKNLN